MLNAYSKIVLRTDFTKKDGTNPICLRITINRKVKIYSLNISVNSNDWNDKTFVKKTHPDSTNYNLDIKNALIKANKIIFEYSLANKNLTLSDFTRLYKRKDFDSGSFYDFIEYQTKKQKGIFSKDTIRTHENHLVKLQKFKPILNFDDINIDLIESYKKYMIVELDNNSNTVSNCLAFLKAQINKAIKEGHLKENPFINLPIQSIKGDRNFLSLNEIKVLEELDPSKLNKPQKTVLKYFLFACYTGLRYQDIKNLRFKDLDNNMITIIMNKTKLQVKIPIIEKAKNLIEFKEPEFQVFKIFANQVTNRYLKEIMSIAGIKKRISFHCARHTFATIGIELGIPLEIISNLLGHSDLKTTSIYSKILDYKKEEYMNLWNSTKEKDPSK
jgi:site-specific recombinase XerD